MIYLAGWLTSLSCSDMIIGYFRFISGRCYLSRNQFLHFAHSRIEGALIHKQFCSLICVLCDYCNAINQKYCFGYGNGSHMTVLELHVWPYSIGPNSNMLCFWVRGFFFHHSSLQLHLWVLSPAVPIDFLQGCGEDVCYLN